MAVSVISHEEFQRLRGTWCASRNDEPERQRARSRSPPVIYFRGKEDVFSNFYEFRLHIFKRTFCSAESAYQYAKAVFHKSWDVAEDLVNSRSGLHAKALSYQIKKCDSNTLDWADLKIDVMKVILYAKIEQCSQFRLLLTDINLRETNLVENTENEFWGYSNGRGSNNLGHLLMLVRHEFVEMVVSPRDIARFCEKVMGKVADKWPDNKTWRELCKPEKLETVNVENAQPQTSTSLSSCNKLSSESTSFHSIAEDLGVASDESSSEASVGHEEDIDLNVSGSYSEFSSINNDASEVNSNKPEQLSGKYDQVQQFPRRQTAVPETTSDFYAGFFLGFFTGGLLMQYYQDMKEKLATNLNPQSVVNPCTQGQCTIENEKSSSVESPSPKQDQVNKSGDEDFNQTCDAETYIAAKQSAEPSVPDQYEIGRASEHWSHVQTVCIVEEQWDQQRAREHLNYINNGAEFHYLAPDHFEENHEHLKHTESLNNVTTYVAPDPSNNGIELEYTLPEQFKGSEMSACEHMYPMDNVNAYVAPDLSHIETELNFLSGCLNLQENSSREVFHAAKGEQTEPKSIDCPKRRSIGQNGVVTENPMTKERPGRGRGRSKIMNS